ncbi:MAG: hypothetical protein FWF84_07680, partial [Kiritimatiellaeota bacterium]|nr:hypothetical protein [Kiritimatiellota bacterium]
MSSIPLTPSVVFIAALGLSLFALVFISVLRHLVASPKKRKEKKMMSLLAGAGIAALLLAYVPYGGMLPKQQSGGSGEDGGGEGNGGERGGQTTLVTETDDSSRSTLATDDSADDFSNDFDLLAAILESNGFSATEAYDVASAVVNPSAWVPYSPAATVAQLWTNAPVLRDAPLALSVFPAKAVFSDIEHDEGAAFPHATLGFPCHCEECTHDEATQHKHAMSLLNVMTGSLFHDPANTARVWRLAQPNGTVMTWENMTVIPTNSGIVASAQLHLRNDGTASYRYKLPPHVAASNLLDLGFVVGTTHDGQVNNWLLDDSFNLTDGADLSLVPTSPGWNLTHCSGDDHVADILKEELGLPLQTPIPNILAPFGNGTYIDELVRAYAPNYPLGDGIGEFTVTVSYDPSVVTPDRVTMFTVGPLVYPLVPNKSYTTTQRLPKGERHRVRFAAAPGFQPSAATVAFSTTNFAVATMETGIFTDRAGVNPRAEDRLAFPVCTFHTNYVCIHLGQTASLEATAEPSGLGKLKWSVWSDNASISPATGESVTVRPGKPF